MPHKTVDPRHAGPETHPYLVHWDNGGDSELQLTEAQAAGLVCIHCGEQDGVVAVATVEYDDETETTARACHSECGRVVRLEAEKEALRAKTDELAERVDKLYKQVLAHLEVCPDSDGSL